MTPEDYRDSLASCIRGISCEIGELVQALGYEQKYASLSLEHAKSGSAKIRKALDRLDALNVRFAALGEHNFSKSD